MKIVLLTASVLCYVVACGRPALIAANPEHTQRGIACLILGAFAAMTLFAGRQPASGYNGSHTFPSAGEP